MRKQVFEERFREALTDNDRSRAKSWVERAQLECPTETGRRTFHEDIREAIIRESQCPSGVDNQPPEDWVPPWDHAEREYPPRYLSNLVRVRSLPHVATTEFPSQLYAPNVESPYTQYGRSGRSASLSPVRKPALRRSGSPFSGSGEISDVRHSSTTSRLRKTSPRLTSSTTASSSKRVDPSDAKDTNQRPSSSKLANGITSNSTKTKSQLSTVSRRISSSRKTEEEIGIKNTSRQTTGLRRDQESHSSQNKVKTKSLTRPETNDLKKKEITSRIDSGLVSVSKETLQSPVSDEVNSFDRNGYQFAKFSTSNVVESVRSGTTVIENQSLTYTEGVNGAQTVDGGQRGESERGQEASLSVERKLHKVPLESPTMVQDILSPPIGSPSSPNSLDPDDKAEREKRERIQKYKEERRKQMAARYHPAVEGSSSSGEEEGSSAAHRRRRKMKHSNVGAARLPASRTENLVSSSLPSPHRVSMATTSSQSFSNVPNNNTDDPGRVELGSDAHRLSSADAAPSSGKEASFTQSDIRPELPEGSFLRPSDGKEEKDKSHKRKSHLNRASTSEEPVVYPTANWSDSSEEVPRRRRRRTPQCTSDGVGGHTSSLSDAPSARPASHSGAISLTPTTANHRLSLTSTRTGGSLKKPEIPDVFRGRETFEGKPPSGPLILGDDVDWMGDSEEGRRKGSRCIVDGILKRPMSSPPPTTEGTCLDPRPPVPILKKRSSGDEDGLKKSILKKRSLTDDELDCLDRPRSILKGSDAGGSSPPPPILKRGSDPDGELRPILKRRDTTEGIAGWPPTPPTPPPLRRRDSAPPPGILKRRGVELSVDEDSVLNGALSVAERVAGMEARAEDDTQEGEERQRASPPRSPAIMDRDVQRSSGGGASMWLSSVSTSFSAAASLVSPGEVSDRLPAEVPSASAFAQPSRVSQKAAFFAKLEQEKTIPSSAPSAAGGKKERGMRFATQPVTERELCRAAHLVDRPKSASAKISGNAPVSSCLSSTSGESVPNYNVTNDENQPSNDCPPDPLCGSVSSPSTSSPLRKIGADSSFVTRRFSAHEVGCDEANADTVKGILKWEGPARDRSKESDQRPKSILKCESRKSSFSEGADGSSLPPRSILKAETHTLSNNKGRKSPEQSAERLTLKSMLKKDSSLDDSSAASRPASAGIKSILKPQSYSFDPDVSSDSSIAELCLESSSPPLSVPSEAVNITLVDSFSASCSSTRPKDNLAEALRQIEPIGDHRETTTTYSVSLTKEDVISNIRNKARMGGSIGSPLGTLSSSSSPPPPMMSPPTGGSPSEATSTTSVDSEIEQIQEELEANLRSLTGFCRDEMTRNGTPSSKGTVKQKSASPAPMSNKDTTQTNSRWTEAPLSPLPQRVPRMDTSPIRTPTSSTSSSSADSPSAFRRRLRSPSPVPSAASGAMPCVSPPRGNSITARLVSLQKNGEEGWKSRIHKDEILSSPKRVSSLSNSVLASPTPPLPGHPKARPTSLVDRVSQLETSSQQWRGRVFVSDAERFTVAHKVAVATQEETNGIEKKQNGHSASIPIGITVSPAGDSSSSSSEEGGSSPPLPQKMPEPRVFRSKTGSCLPDVVLRRPRPEGPSAAQRFLRSTSEYAPNVTADADEEDMQDGKTISIPRPDDNDFDSFFASSTSKKSSFTAEGGNHTMSLDFDAITVDLSSQLLATRRDVRVSRNHRTSRNPVRSLASREDVRSEYTHVSLGVGSKELRRMKVEELSRSSTLAMEALAGLASREDFGAVALRRVDPSALPQSKELAPFVHPMLVRVKGRRHPQVRLVEPHYTSVNEGDDFILITRAEIFHYQGRFSNVLERALASEIAAYCLTHKDLGLAPSGTHLTELHADSSEIKKKRFWENLEGDARTKARGVNVSGNDDAVESSLVASNCIYEVDGDALTPIPDAWGQVPKVELLEAEKVLVFDFGAELYLWCGKCSSASDKRCGTHMIRSLWRETTDRSHGTIVGGSDGHENGVNAKVARPDWGICAKITENVETILFKEKFLDWPDVAQQSRMKEVRQEEENRSDAVNELSPSDATRLLDDRAAEPDLILEMSHLGRGLTYYDQEERRLHNVSTGELRVWHVSESEKIELREPSSAHFHDTNTYVVRWYYHVTSSGRTLKGLPSKHNVTGRWRVAYFFWQGRQSSVSDKGASALLTVELDEERGPHVRVDMGHEPPAFLNLFRGSFVVHQGRRAKTEDNFCHNNNEDTKMFVVRGEMPTEAHLTQVEVSNAHLRSRGCVVLIDTLNACVYLWVGAKATPTAKEVASIAARSLTKDVAPEVGWSASAAPRVIEESEGEESEAFRRLLRLPNPSQPLVYFSEPSRGAAGYDWTTRIWRLEAEGDVLAANEVTSSYRAMEQSCAQPVWQRQLYDVQQPALFLIDAGVKVYVWQGWWPLSNEEDVTTGSAPLRFTFARKAALKTAVQLATLKENRVVQGQKHNGTFTLSDVASICEPQLVVAGCESLQFTNLFTVWQRRSDVAQIQEKEGRWSPGKEYHVRDVLRQLSRDRYSLSELRASPLPDGVDPLRLENYLSDEEFRETLTVTRREFIALPSWKQLQLKKNAKLF